MATGSLSLDAISNRFQMLEVRCGIWTPTPLVNGGWRAGGRATDWRKIMPKQEKKNWMA